MWRRGGKLEIASVSSLPSSPAAARGAAGRSLVGASAGRALASSALGNERGTVSLARVCHKPGAMVCWCSITRRTAR